MRKVRWWALALVALCINCAGLERGCSSCWAENVGADWIVVQLDMNGQTTRCWQLNNVSITNEQSSDGIYWKETGTQHLVHISGWYNRVQVSGGNFASAAKTLGVSLRRCTGGVYEPATPENKEGNEDE